jgi:hypothetical protein
MFTTALSIFIKKRYRCGRAQEARLPGNWPRKTLAGTKFERAIFSVLFEEIGSVAESGPFSRAPMSSRVADKRTTSSLLKSVCKWGGTLSNEFDLGQGLRASEYERRADISHCWRFARGAP